MPRTRAQSVLEVFEEDGRFTLCCLSKGDDVDAILIYVKVRDQERRTREPGLLGARKAGGAVVVGQLEEAGGGPGSGARSRRRSAIAGKPSGRKKARAF